MSTASEVDTNACVPAEPQAEHKWLDQLLGDWVYEASCKMVPGQPDIKTSGKETVRSLGGLWILGEGEGKTPDGKTMYSRISVGYNPDTKRYVGTWICSVMTHMWVYDGEVDAAKKVLTLNAEGPDFTKPGKTAKFQDIIEIVNADHHILRSQALGDDGKWVQFMEAHYKRAGK